MPFSRVFNRPSSLSATDKLGPPVQMLLKGRDTLDFSVGQQRAMTSPRPPRGATSGTFDTGIVPLRG